MLQNIDTYHFENNRAIDQYHANFDDLGSEEMPKFLVLWALRACIVGNGSGSFHCKGLLRAIHDWFGTDAEELIHSAQIIAWANYQAGDVDMRFKPTASEGFRNEEKALFATIDAINDNNPMAANDLCQTLTGALSDIAFVSFLSLAKIMRKLA